MVPKRQYALAASKNAVITDLVDRYEAVLKRFFARKIGVTADVDDLVQDVFYRLSRLDAPEEIEHPQAYLFQIAQNILKDRARRAFTRHENQHESFEDDKAFQFSVSTEEIVIGRETLARLRNVILRLPPRTAHVFSLSRFDGLSYREIAEVFGVSVSSVEKHMMKALSALAKAVDI